MAEHDDQDSYGRAIVYGSVCLNDIFVARNPRFRIFRRSSIRLSLVEIVWILLMTFAWILVIFPTMMLLSMLPLLGTIVSPFIMSLFGIPLGWFTGRRIARASPYRYHSGEGLATYLYVQSDKKSTLFGRIFGRKVATNECVTMVKGKKVTTGCIEWIGTARSPLAPKGNGADSLTYMNVDMPPKCVPVDWVEMYRQDRQRLATIEKMTS